MELLVTLVIPCLFFSTLAYFIYKMSQDLEYCITEHHKQKRRKEYDALMKDIQRDRDFEALQWFSYEREKTKEMYKELGATDEQLEQILGQEDSYYNELSNKKYQ